MMHGVGGETFREPLVVPGVEGVGSDLVEAHAAQRRPDALVYLGPILSDRGGSASGLDLLEPFVQELANGGPGPIEPARLHVGYEAGQRLDGCTLRALKGPGDLDGSARRRIGPGEGPELPLA